MTYKYWEIRREVYNKDPEKKMHRSRSIKECRKLYKPGFWLMFFSLFGCVLLMSISATCNWHPLYFFVFFVLSVIIMVVGEIIGEKCYNSSARAEELRKNRVVYDEYIQEIKDILRRCNIDTEKKRDLLKEECRERLGKQKKPWSMMNTRIYDVFIGIPIGSLITVLMTQENIQITIPGVAIILVGIIMIMFSKLINKLLYYAYGNFKDQYLLDVLNEIEYSERV